MNHEFSDLKARRKVKMKHFRVEMTRTRYFRVWEGYHGLAQIIKQQVR